MIDYEKEEQEWEDFCRLGVELKTLTALTRAEFAKTEKYDVTIGAGSEITIHWKKNGLGEGDISVAVYDNGDIVCANEYLHPSIIRKILHSAADKIVDTATFSEV